MPSAHSRIQVWMDYLTLHLVLTLLQLYCRAHSHLDLIIRTSLDARERARTRAILLKLCAVVSMLHILSSNFYAYFSVLFLRIFSSCCCRLFLCIIHILDYILLHGSASFYLLKCSFILSRFAIRFFLSDYRTKVCCFSRCRPRRFSLIFFLHNNLMQVSDSHIHAIVELNCTQKLGSTN